VSGKNTGRECLFWASDKFDNESVITRIFRMLWTV